MLLTPNLTRIPPVKVDAFRDALESCILEGGSEEFEALERVARECSDLVKVRLVDLPGCDPMHGPQT